MFSSTYDSNLFPNFPSSSYPTLPFLIDPENDFASNNNNNNNTFLDDPFLIPFDPTTTTHDSPFPDETVANFTVSDCTAMLEQDIANTNYASQFGSISNFLTQKPAIAKKDRHSKIHTSQGLRDRRVRLSSEIARKFFDLQDMLEFDKPSNTLEWLFTKSENAIKELARSKHSGSSSGGDNKCSSDPSVGLNNNNSNKSLVDGGGGGGSKGRKLKWSQRDDVCVQTKKESRERARARARERTCHKMCSSRRLMQQEFDETCPATATTQMLHQLRSSFQPEHERWVQPYNNPYLVDYSEVPRDHGYNVIEESIMIKRNMMRHSSSSLNIPSHHHHQNQNLVIPRDASFNNNECHLLPYSAPNWDNGLSNFCGIGTMNHLSTCFMNPCCGAKFSNLWKFLGGVHQSESTLMC